MPGSIAPAVSTPASLAPTVSVVLPTKNRQAQLQACVQSVWRQSVAARELIIIDQSAQPLSPAALEAVADAGGASQFVYRWEPGLTGLPQARNFALQFCAGEVVLFLDDDVVLEPDYLQQLLSVYAADASQQVGGAGGRDLSPSLLRQGWLHRLAQGVFRRGPFHDSLQEFRLHPPSRPVDATHLSGCNMSFRRQVFTEFRFDENLVGYANGEDLDFCQRVARRYRLAFVPAARLVHCEAPVSRDSTFAFYSNKILHAYYLFRKNFTPSVRVCACFAWLNLGYVLDALAKADLRALRGTLEGYRRILRALRQPGLAGLVEELQRG